MFLLMNIVGVQKVSEDKLEDACDLCDYKDDARGVMKTHNTSFHKCMLCICNHCDYKTGKGFLICHQLANMRMKPCYKGGKSDCSECY